MSEVYTNFKQPKGPKAKGRARPNEPLAVQCEMEWCTAAATERHHILPRAAGGTDEAENTRDWCSACHRDVHAHPSLSYAMGWLKRRGAA